MSTTTRRSARNQALPPDEASQLVMLRGFDRYRRVWQLYNAGWTLRAIGEAFDPVKSRSTIQSWVEKGREIDTVPITASVPIPTYVTPPVYIPVRPVSPGISPSDLDIIQTLAPIARKFRSGMHPAHTAARANSDLTALCVSLNASGVSITELAEAAGVTYRAMSKRLGRS